MVLTNIQIFTQMGIGPAVSRNAIIGDFLSEGLEGLQHMTEEEVRDACESYAKRHLGLISVVVPLRKLYLIYSLMSNPAPSISADNRGSPFKLFKHI